MNIPKSKSDYEIFISKDGTQYKWNKSQEIIVKLTEEELLLLKFKVTLLPDNDILNRESGNGVTMGISINLSKPRLDELSHKLVTIIKRDPTIILSDHVIERIILESLGDNPDKRGWNDEEEVKNCIITARRVTGVRLNINHSHPFNTTELIHLNPHLALVIQGKKDDNENGRLVLAVLADNEIRVVTIL